MVSACLELDFSIELNRRLMAPLFRDAKVRISPNQNVEVFVVEVNVRL